MKPRLAGLALLAAFAVAAAATATGFGDGSSRGPDAIPSRVSAHRVTAPSNGAKIAAARRHRTRLIYKETAPTTLETGTHEVSIGRCPRRSASINGYYLPDDFGVNLEATGRIRARGGGSSAWTTNPERRGRPSWGSSA
jgi:hypothetical protein